VHMADLLKEKGGGKDANWRRFCTSRENWMSTVIAASKKSMKFCGPEIPQKIMRELLVLLKGKWSLEMMDGIMATQVFLLNVNDKTKKS